MVRDEWMVGLGGKVLEDRAGAGLLTDLAALDGPDFTAADWRPRSGTSTGTPPTGGWRCAPAGRRCSGPAASSSHAGSASASNSSRSPGDCFGGNGAYVVVDDGGRPYAARAPIRETSHVYVDREGLLRTDHALRRWSATAVRLHYRLDRRRHGQGDLRM